MNKEKPQLSFSRLSNFWFRSTDKMFEAFTDFVVDADIPRKRHIFMDNGGDVLLVAHLDTVLNPVIKAHKKGRVYAQGLDDRLGACIAYKLSKMLGADLLLCDLEEEGRSTAQHFDAKGKYNWICEFDRAGKDVVTYDIDSQEWINTLGKTWYVGFGSFSDVAFMDVDVCVMNLGIGYEHAHSYDSYASFETMNSQIKKFIDFYLKYHDTRFDLDDDFINPNTAYMYYCDNAVYSKYDWMCEVCGDCCGEDIFGHTICETCFRYMFQSVLGV